MARIVRNTASAQRIERQRLATTATPGRMNPAEPNAQPDSPNATRHCTKCNTLQPVTNFCWHNKARSQRTIRELQRADRSWHDPKTPLNRTIEVFGGIRATSTAIVGMATEAARRNDLKVLALALVWTVRLATATSRQFLMRSQGFTLLFLLGVNQPCSAFARCW
jgi:hypothetical protein